MTEPHPRDPGLQQERTVLAWRRTGLALVVGALGIGRLTMDTLGTGVLVPAAVAVALAAWVVLISLRKSRYAATHPAEPSFTTVLADGRVPLVVAVVAGALAFGELTAAVTQLVR